MFAMNVQQTAAEFRSHEPVQSDVKLFCSGHQFFDSTRKGS